MALVVTTTFLTGCESDEERKLRLEREHEIKMAKIQSGQYAIERDQEHERRMAFIQRDQDIIQHEQRMAYIQRPVMPIAPGNYIDYRGNLDYGYWGPLGWTWHDPDSAYAIQSRRYVDYQIATGVLAAGYLSHALTRDRWERENRGGWKKTTVVVNNYTSVKGETLSKRQYDSNYKKAEVKQNKWKKEKRIQSKYAKDGWHQSFAKKKKAQDAASKKTTTQNTKSVYSKSSTKTVQKPKVDANKLKQEKLKAELKAKQAKRVADKKRQQAQQQARAKAEAKARKRREDAARKAKQKKVSQKKY